MFPSTYGQKWIQQTNLRNGFDYHLIVDELRETIYIFEAFFKQYDEATTIIYLTANVMLKYYCDEIRVSPKHT